MQAVAEPHETGVSWPAVAPIGFWRPSVVQVDPFPTATSISSPRDPTATQRVEDVHATPAR